MSELIEKSDWVRFTEMLPAIRERYLAGKNDELAAMLLSEGPSPSEKFRKAEEFIQREGKILKLCLGGQSRARQTMFMALMYRYHMLSDHDLDLFSETLAKQVRGFTAI